MFDLGTSHKLPKPHLLMWEMRTLAKMVSFFFFLSPDLNVGSYFQVLPLFFLLTASLNIACRGH